MVNVRQWPGAALQARPPSSPIRRGCVVGQDPGPSRSSTTGDGPDSGRASRELPPGHRPHALEAREVYRAALANGVPFNGKALAARYARSEPWGRTRTRECRTTWTQPGPAATAESAPVLRLPLQRQRALPTLGVASNQEGRADMAEDISIGDTLRDLRAERDLTQEGLAEAARLHVNTARKIEQGGTGSIDLPPARPHARRDHRAPGRWTTRTSTEPRR